MAKFGCSLLSACFAKCYLQRGGASAWFPNYVCDRLSSICAFQSERVSCSAVLLFVVQLARVKISVASDLASSHRSATRCRPSIPDHAAGESLWGPRDSPLLQVEEYLLLNTYGSQSYSVHVCLVVSLRPLVRIASHSQVGGAGGGPGGGPGGRDDHDGGDDKRIAKHVSTSQRILAVAV